MIEGPKLIAELGINHQGNSDIALKMIEAAALAGAWAVKFQYRNLERVGKGLERQIGGDMVAQNTSDSYLNPGEILALVQDARRLGLRVGISFFVAADLEDFHGDEFDFFKVPSAELTNSPLIETLVRTEKLVLLSTGMHAEGDIVRVLRRYDKRENLVPMHCVSNYPTRIDNAKLGYIDFLRHSYSGPIGFSSHDEDWKTCLVALGMGVQYIERHLTLDKQLKGTDHSSSSTPEEFVELSRFCRSTGLLDGNGPREMNQGEKIARQNLGRGLFAKQSRAAGDSITPGDFEYVSPRLGPGYEVFSRSKTLRLLMPISQGEALSSRHIEGEDLSLDDGGIARAKGLRLSLPVRLHDLDHVHRKFALKDFEFHFSYGEMGLLENWDGFVDGAAYSVHLPDYLDAYNLINPLSTSSDVRGASLKIFDQAFRFGARLRLRGQENVYLISSLSQRHTSREQWFQEVSGLLRDWSEPGIHLSLQWLPPFAWYFGGSVELNVMNSLEDVPFIRDLSIPVTMDLSHLLMGANAGLYNPIEVIDALSENIVHFHLSGADGDDGEGAAFSREGRWDIPLLARAFSDDFASSAKVLEVWQGHLDDFRGFGSALKDLLDLSRSL